VDDVTLSVPAVIVRAFAMPNIALVDNFNSVPLSTTFARLAVPFNVELPVNVVIVPEEEKVPLIFNPDETLMDEVEVMDPLTVKEDKENAPAPLMALLVPLMVITPVLADNDPVNTKLPVNIKEEVVLTDAPPEMVRLSNWIPDPVIVLVAPLMVNVPPEE
jgi:hypothetical protein